MVDASSDLLKDFDDRVSSPSSGMQSKKVLKLLPYPGACSRCCYRTVAEEVIHLCSHPCVMTEVGEMRSYDNLNKMDVVSTSTEVEDLEAAVRTLLEVTSWMDCGFTLLNP